MATTARARDVRVFVYAGFDLAMAVLYAVVLFGLIPSRHTGVQIMAGLMVGAALAMGFAMLVRRPWSFWIGVAGCAALLFLAVAFLVLTLSSAAFLAGVYGGFGRAAAAFALIGAALVIELLMLLPAFQLKFLLTRAGRRLFAAPPVAARAAGAKE